MRNAFTVSDARKPKKVFDKKVPKTKRFSRIRTRFPKAFLGFKRFPRKPFGPRKESRVSENTVEGFRMRTLKNPLVSGDSETHWVFSETHDRAGNLFGYVYRFPKGFPKGFGFPGKRFLFRVYTGQSR